MKLYNYLRRSFPLLMGLIVLVGLFACTDQTSLHGEEFNFTTEKSDISITTLEHGFTYPTSVVEKSLKAGLGNPRMIPYYKSPSDELFERFKSRDHFVFTLDKEEISQSSLQDIDRADIKAYRVIEVSDNPAGFQLKVDLYTHEGFIALADNWMETMLAFKNGEFRKG